MDRIWDACDFAYQENKDVIKCFLYIFFITILVYIFSLINPLFKFALVVCFLAAIVWLFFLVIKYIKFISFYLSYSETQPEEK